MPFSTEALKSNPVSIKNPRFVFEEFCGPSNPSVRSDRVLSMRNKGDSEKPQFVHSFEAVISKAGETNCQILSVGPVPFGAVQRSVRGELSYGDMRHRRFDQRRHLGKSSGGKLNHERRVLKNRLHVRFQRDGWPNWDRSSFGGSPSLYIRRAKSWNERSMETAARLAACTYRR